MMGDIEAAIRETFPGTTVHLSIESRMALPVESRVAQAKMRGMWAWCEACDGNREMDGLARKSRVAPEFAVDCRFVVVLPDTTRQTRKLIETTMRKVGIEVGRVSWVPVVGCEWGEAASPGATRHPCQAEIKTCAGNVADAIYTANTDHVLLVGGVGKDMWRPDFRRIADVAGRVGALWDRYVCMVIENPAGVMHLQGGAKREFATRLTRQMEGWKQVVDDGGEGVMVDGVRMPVTALMARQCAEAECRSEDVVVVDRDALGWCAVHRNERWMIGRGLTPDGGVQEGLF